MSKKYRDYKKDSTLKIPFLAWLVDRVGVISYVLLSAFTVAVLVLLSMSGLNAWAKINEKPESSSPYMEIEARNSQGQNWAKNIIKQKPKTLKKWNVAESTKPQNISSSCTITNDVSTSLLSTYSASGSGAHVNVQLYGAGQAAKDFNKYVSIIDKCATVEKKTVDSGSAVVYDKSFMLTMGDSIISVKANDNKQRDSLLEFYSQKMLETLKASSCLDLKETDKDAYRSFYYDKKSYTGLKETTKVETNVSTTNIPNPSNITIDDIKNPDATEPESPLPANFSDMPDKEEPKPSLPEEIEDQNNFNVNAVYNVADTNGPGCGWGWSAQESPVYDKQDLENKQLQTIADKQNEIDEKAQNYVDDKMDWSTQSVLIMPKVDKWNSYAKKVNKIHDDWTWLNSEREKLYQPWQDYVNAHNEWITFDQRKADATDKYNDELQTCVDKQDALLDWEDKWGELYDKQQSGDTSDSDQEDNTEKEDNNSTDETETPSDSTDGEKEEETPSDESDTANAPEAPVEIPDKPEGCSTLPERPAIVDQAKPDEPQAPEIPEGVTIPDSWEQPKE